MSRDRSLRAARAYLAEITDLAGGLRLGLLAERLTAYERGGYPAGRSDGRGGPGRLPLPDGLDRHIDRDRRGITAELAKTRDLLRDVSGRQEFWLVAVPPPPEPPRVCGNVACDRVVSGIGNDRLRDGRCSRCYTWRRRHGGEWSPRRDATAAAAP